MLDFDGQKFFYRLFVLVNILNTYQAFSYEDNTLEDQSEPRLSYASSFVPALLDTHGEGKQRVYLPLEYYKRQEKDNFSIVYQVYYKLYHISESYGRVAVLAPLSPCIGIVVTDGIKLITFHNHFSISSRSMLEVIQENLDLSDPNNLYARLYSAKNDDEWRSRSESKNHGGKSHQQEIEDLRRLLMDHLKIPPRHLSFDLPDVDSSSVRRETLLKYEDAVLSIAVRLDVVFEELGSRKRINFMAIDPITEDVFGYGEREFPLSYAILVTMGRSIPDIEEKMIYTKDISRLVNHGASRPRIGHLAQRVFYKERIRLEEEEKIFALKKKDFDERKRSSSL
ncbi:MAG: hypothetical protein K0M45_11565 [Candidatus Paracaedibacteraceae bacterium]|nr:hypothetical protein [Candidatus Paracaedibacteraceae bacterium]